jgi:PII-like signaling protein
METTTDSLLLRIFIGEASRFGHQPLHEAIMLKAREMHLAGATVTRGSMGYGKSSLVHTTKILRLSDDLPVIIEIVDSEAKINAFLPALGQMMTSGVAVVDKVRAIHYQRASGAP